MTADEVRLGHAVRTTDFSGDREVLDWCMRLTQGTCQLAARPPSDNTAVKAAEHALGIAPEARPIYAFVGDLHPGLGALGLIIARSWTSADGVVQGVSRCDSGGLAAGRGSFEHAGDDDARRALLVELSSPQTCASNAWPNAFRQEVSDSFEGRVMDYVTGLSPSVDGWGEKRREFFRKVEDARGSIDRRLWTWEIRAALPPGEKDIVMVVLTPELAKLDDPEEAGTFPDSVRVYRNRVGSTGAQFSAPEVRSMLRGDGA